MINKEHAFPSPNTTCLKSPAIKWSLPCTAHSIPSQPASSRLLHQQPSAGHRELPEAHAQRERPESSNGVRVPLQRLRRQQGEEAAAQEGAAQGADRQDPAGQPRGAGRRRRRQQGAQLREMSKLLLADRTL